jgi:hypothetical protein
MALQRGSRRHRIRTAALVVLGAVACDLGVEPLPDAPLLALSSREASLFVTRGSGEDDEVAIQISNNGTGTLSGLAWEGPVYTGANPGWLDVTLQDTTLTLTARAVTADGDTLETGSYDAQVLVVADAASNSPRTIAVNLQVGKSQQMALSVGKVTFGAQATEPEPPVHQTVAISNAGDGVLSRLAIDSIAYRGGEPDGWLDTTLVWTRAPNRAPAVVELQPNSVPLSETTLHATVFVGSQIADPPVDSIRVEYIVAPPPTLVLSTTTLEIESVAGDAGPFVYEVALRELNRRPLTGLTDAVSPNPGWLSSSRDADEAPATLTITVNPAGLVGGTVYQDTVFVSSSAGEVEEIAVSLRVQHGPTLHLSMDAVRFTMNPTDPLPITQLVRIENSGAGTLSGLGLEDPQPAPWLLASLLGPTAPSDLVLQIVDTIARGTVETAPVTVTGPGDRTASVTVELEMLPGPSIVLSSDTVTFRSENALQDTLMPPPLTLTVANGGTGVLGALQPPTVEYIPPGDPPWLGIAVLANTTAATTLELQPSTVPDTGVYTAQVVIASGMSGVDADTLAVLIEAAQNTLPNPTIGLSSDSVLFRYVKTEAVPEVVVGLENRGSQSFRNLKIDEKPGWLTASFEGGDDPPTTLRLRLKPEALDGLTPPLNDLVRISAKAGGTDPDPVDLVVRLEVAGPEMVATSDRVVFRAYEGQTALPVSQTVTVSNRASGTSPGVYASDWPTWLTVTPVNPGLPASAPVVMGPDKTDLASPPDDQVEVIAEAADNSPLQIEVAYEIDAGPTLVVASDTVRLSSVEGSSAPDTVTVDLFNSGKGDLGVLGAANSQPWDTAFIDPSVVPARLVVVARADTLNSSTYRDNVAVTSTSGGTAIVAVAFGVAPQPEIQVSPAALVFHADALMDSVPPEQTISVFDPAGGPSGQIAATSAATWLSVDVNSSTAPVTVVVRPKEVLDSRDSPYVDSVAVSSTVGTGESQTVIVTYNIDVGRDPVIDLSTDRLEFRRPTSADDIVLAQNVEITNGGSRTLRELSVEDVTEGGPVDWLFVLLDSRIAPATLTVAIKPAEAAATNRPTATLEITGEDAQARRLTVVLREGG